VIGGRTVRGRVLTQLDPALAGRYLSASVYTKSNYAPGVAYIELSASGGLTASGEELLLGTAPQNGALGALPARWLSGAGQSFNESQGWWLKWDFVASFGTNPFIPPDPLSYPQGVYRPMTTTPFKLTGRIGRNDQVLLTLSVDGVNPFSQAYLCVSTAG
jgi:hypothetical protein